MSSLPVGAPAPAFHLASLATTPLTLDALRASVKPVLLVFSDPSYLPTTLGASLNMPAAWLLGWGERVERS